MVGGKLRIPVPLTALLALIPDFNNEELEALMCYLPTQDDANHSTVMIVAEAKEVSDM